MLKSFYLCCIALTLLLACTARDHVRSKAWEQKLDPLLRTALRQEAVQIQATQTLHVLLKCAAPLAEQQKKALAALGVRVQAEAGNIVTAAMPQTALTEVAKLDYIIYLALSKERKTLSPGN